MSSRRYPPAYLRYWKARLLNFTRPAFWGTALFLSITGLATWELMTKPDLLSNFRRNQVVEEENSRLSPEERAIAADIDNLPVLFFDFEQAALPKVASVKTQSEQQANISPRKIESPQKNRQTKLVSDNVAKAKDFKIDNPFLKKAENLLKLELLPIQQAGTMNGQAMNGQAMNGQAINPLANINNISNQNQPRSIINPLQAQLNPASTYPQYSYPTSQAVPQTALQLAINQSRQTNQNQFNQPRQLTPSPVIATTNPIVNTNRNNRNNLNNQNYPYSPSYSPRINQNTNIESTANQAYYPTLVTRQNQNQPLQQINRVSRTNNQPLQQINRANRVNSDRNNNQGGYYTNTYSQTNLTNSQTNSVNTVNNPFNNPTNPIPLPQPATINYAPMPIQP